MASLLFRPVCDARGNLCRWLNQFARRSGVYVIRQPGLVFSTVLYVGESHSGTLKKTILRHFQKWTGKTAGPTYPRTKVEVAVAPTSAETAVSRQNALIRELSPRDNTVENDPWRL